MNTVNTNIEGGFSSPHTTTEIEACNANIRRQRADDEKAISFDERWKASAKAIIAAGQHATQNAIESNVAPTQLTNNNQAINI